MIKRGVKPQIVRRKKSVKPYPDCVHGSYPFRLRPFELIWGGGTSEELRREYPRASRIAQDSFSNSDSYARLVRHGVTVVLPAGSTVFIDVNDESLQMCFHVERIVTISDLPGTVFLLVTMQSIDEYGSTALGEVEDLAESDHKSAVRRFDEWMLGDWRFGDMDANYFRN